MAKMSDFRKSRDKKTVQATADTESPKRERQENAIASPMIDSRSKMAGGIKKTERMTIVLPVSGNEIEMTSTEVIPLECSIHPRNQRVQELLSVNNPKVASLKLAIKRDKQREPVISRWIEVDGEPVLEILDGSRRRFVCEQLHKEDQSTLLKAWVGKIPDADAEFFAKFGNDDRDDVSAWEKAKALKRIELENPSWSHEVIAANERISRQSVSNLLSIADIPLEIVFLLESPNLLKVNSGIQVAKLIREANSKSYIESLSKHAPYSKFSDLANRLKVLLKPKVIADIPVSNRKVEIKKKGKVRASIGLNRKIKGQYKVDLFGLSETEYEDVLSALDKILK